MRVRVFHQIKYRFASPARFITHGLRLTPRNDACQRVGQWWIDTDTNDALRVSEDAFGNIVHTLSTAGPRSELTITAQGLVDTFDMAGVVRGAIERFPPELYLRPTPLTTTDDVLRNFAGSVDAGDEPLARMHALLSAVHDAMKFDESATSHSTTAAEAFGRCHGAARDFAQIFVACARHLDTPARYVSGYILPADGAEAREAGHAWAEAFVPALGWVGFDPVNGMSPDESHVSVARGLDYLGAAPVRSARAGDDAEASVRIVMAREDGATNQ